MIGPLLGDSDDLRIRLSGGNIDDTVSAPTTEAQASLVVDHDGNVYALTSLGSTQLSSSTDWIRPVQFAPGGAEPSSVGVAAMIRATLQSGSTPSGTLDTWLDTSIDRSWFLSQSGAGSKSCSLLIEIRGGTGTALWASGTYGISVEVI